MPDPIRTLEQTIAWEQARIGKSRLQGDADWAGGVDIDDCALFQSTAVFGQKLAWNVDVFETLDGGTYHLGKSGLRRGDVVLYDWSGPGSHTEMALAAPDGSGDFNTIGANRDASAAVKEGIRNGYVQGYFRPNYLPATTPESPATKEDDMPDLKTITLPQGQKLTKSTENWLHIDKKTNISLVSGKQTVQAIGHVTFQGLPVGQALHARFVVSTCDKTGKETKRALGGVVEVVGTSGGTLWEFTDAFELGTNDRLRVLLNPPVAGVTVDGGTLKTLSWK